MIITQRASNVTGYVKVVTKSVMCTLTHAMEYKGIVNPLTMEYCT